MDSVSDGVISTKWRCRLLALVVACGGCGGKAAGDGATQGPDAEQPAAVCAETPRNADDEATNAATLDMAEHAKAGLLLPVLVSLVEVPYANGAKPAERMAQVAPSQAPVLKRLNELGAQKVEPFWLTNSISASVEPAHVRELLCLPNVVRIDVDAAYWDVVAPPWGPDEAGSLECPLVGEQCPEHCFDFMGVPVDENTGCYSFGERERVGCSITTPGINDGAASCRKQVATGKEYVFFSFVPVPPNFVGWTDCDSPAQVSMCE